MRKLRRRGLFVFLAVVGPGIITCAADNDAGGIATYSVAGAHFGFQMLWLLVVVTLVLIVINEMSARMGVVTQKGLGELIREQFGVKWTFFALSCLFVANGLTTVAEFAGISAAAEIFGIHRAVAVPVCALFVWLIVLRGSFRIVERVFLGFSAIYITYIISGFMAKPDWQHALVSSIRPQFQPDAAFIYTAIALVGTTITPWMQFFLQATVVDKGVRIKEYAYQKLDVIVGSILTDVVSFFIIVATAATLYARGITIRDAADAAIALEPFAKGYAKTLFAIGLFNASLLASAVLPLSTAYTYCESFGWEIGVSRSYKEAPAFYGIYTALIAVGAIVALLPGFDPIKAMLLAQFVQGILLPIILIFMLKLINDPEIMGEHVNSAWYNVVTWATVAGLTLLTALLLLSSLLPGLMGGLLR